jgi:hypothetical protein
VNAAAHAERNVSVTPWELQQKSLNKRNRRTYTAPKRCMAHVAARTGFRELSQYLQYRVQPELCRLT